MINNKVLSMTVLFYSVFYVCPLFVIPTFLVNPQTDFLLYSSLFIEPYNSEIPRYVPQLPSSAASRGEESSGLHDKLLGWAYDKLNKYLFVTANFNGITHTFIKIRPAYVMCLGVAGRVNAIINMRKKFGW